MLFPSWKWKWKSLSRVQLFETPWTTESMKFSIVHEILSTGVDSHSLLQGIFPTQRLNPGLPHCRWILYQLSHQGGPMENLNASNDTLFFQLLFMWQNIKFPTANKQIKLGGPRAPSVHRLCQHKQNYIFQRVIQLIYTCSHLCVNILTEVSKSLDH